MKTLDVYGLYGESWQGEIVPDAFAHPAKFSRALIRWIYQHCLEEGYIKPGDKVVDPFGGVALGGLDAMRNGLHWTGVELEGKFVDLGQGYDCPGFTRLDWRRYHGRARYINRRTDDPRQVNVHHWCSDCQKGLDIIPENRVIPSQEPHRYLGNIDLWNERYAQWFANWGTAQLIQGDSRQLAGLVCGAQACVGSPPYASGEKGHPSLGSVNKDAWGKDGRDIAARRSVNGEYGKATGQLAEMPEGSVDAAITSPPFGEGETRNRSEHQGGAVGDMMTRAYTQDRQGITEGNLATLKADTEGYAAAIGSPPYADSVNQSNGANDSNARLQRKQRAGVDISKADRVGGPNSVLNKPQVYGSEDGQLGAMKEGNLDAVISSPPYADAVKTGEGPGARHDPIHHKGDNAYKKSSQAEYGSTPGNLGNMAACVSSPPYEGAAQTDSQQRGIPDLTRTKSKTGDRYGHAVGNIDNDSGETFWQAAKTIVEQVYMVLKPGGYSVWVCKNFVRNKQIVEFSNQWQALCEACGFVPVERIRAWVIEEKGTQLDIFGNEHTKTIERKSFFRRLAERKGSPRIDWEDVIVMRRPE